MVKARAASLLRSAYQSDTAHVLSSSSVGAAVSCVESRFSSAVLELLSAALSLFSSQLSSLLELLLAALSFFSALLSSLVECCQLCRV